jgi:membrane peptidoglycan carboxypeptidase
LLRAWQDWKPVDHATVAFGQGLGVTAVQLTAAMGVLAGGGKLRTPHLVSARRTAGGEWQPVVYKPAQPVISKDVAARVLLMLESVVSSEGTGRKAALRGVRVAGKTGTAQKLDVKRGAYSNTRYNAWFMGAAPADDPKLVIVAMLDEPKGWAHGGGDVAAPLFARVAAGQLALLGVVTHPEPIPAPPRAKVAPVLLAKSESKPAESAEPVETAPKQTPAQRTAETNAPQKSARNLVVAKQETVEPTSLPSKQTAVSVTEQRTGEPVMMPDFTGETLESVRKMAARNKLNLRISGTGLAIDQRPTPGTIVMGSERKVIVRFSSGGREG